MFFGVGHDRVLGATRQQGRVRTIFGVREAEVCRNAVGTCRWRHAASCAMARWPGGVGRGRPGPATAGNGNISEA
ncbi:hypothetical protein RR42_m0681 [Cupriavidus basilensis]|uniref:Uncharacterized protein n=1 Tax=Cupriavidus basilensis TaxID=68895 RepID=A0A0C4Y5E3_9BURK|nr:hypothetical protein RR42_m0681 [Cupriavidus basilensis]